MLKKLSFVKKGVIICVSAAVVVVAAVIVIGMIFGSKTEAYRLLKVFELSGKATVERSSVGELEAYAGMNLESGDVLTVDEGGYMGLSLDDDKYVYIDEGTVLELVATGSAADSRTTINLREGFIINEVRNPLSADSSYCINTPTATMAVRGTITFNSVNVVDTDLILYLNGILKGSAELTDGQNKTITIGRQQYSAILDNGGVVTPINLANVDITSPSSLLGAPAASGALPVSELSQLDIDRMNRIGGLTLNTTIQTYVPLTGSGDAPLTEIDGNPNIATVSSNGTITTVSAEGIQGELATQVDEIINVGEGGGISVPAVTTIDPLLNLTNGYTSQQSSVSQEQPASQSSTQDDVNTTSQDDEPAESTGDGYEVIGINLLDGSVLFTKYSSDWSSPDVLSEENVADGVAHDNGSVLTYNVNKAISNGLPNSALKGYKQKNIEVNIDTSDDSNRVECVYIYYEPIVLTFVNETKTDRITYSSSMTMPELPEKAGYTVKWCVEGSENEFSMSMLNNDDITIKAVYTYIGNYTVTFVEQNGAVVGSLTKKNGAEISASEANAVAARDGYSVSFSHGFPLIVNSDMEVTVTYSSINAPQSEKLCTVTFENSDGTFYAQRITKVGGTLNELPQVPTHGNMIGVWMYGESVFTSATVVNGDITVKAVYISPTIYTVTFVDESGVQISEKSAEDNTSLGASIPAVPDKAGYTGVWKYSGAEFTADTLITGDITVTAVYTINNYTVTFMNGASRVAAATADYNTALGANLPAVPDRTGYTGKWTYGGAEFTAETLVTGDITVTAEYTINSYTVTFTNDDETELYTKTADYNTTLEANLPAVPDRTGYTGKWTYGGAEFTATTLITSDITVTAEYTINSYTVTFTSDDETELYTKTADYNTALGANLPAVPDRTGYTGKWTYGGAEFTATTLITSDITVTAEYTINSYTVTFTNDDETELYTKTADYNTTLGANLPAVPDRTGYTGKWTYGGAEFTATTLITSDITVTVEYTINSYTVTFTSDDETELYTKTADYNTTLGANLPAVPDRTGYTGKWTYGGAEFTATTLITSDITVTVEYTINNYTVTFTNDDETELYTKTADYNTTLGANLPAVPDRTGYTGKWTYGGAEFTATTLITSDITVTVEYTINSYNVTFKNDDETELYTKTADYNTALGANLPAVPDRTGYTGKWTYGGAEFTATTLITSDITVTAEYTINSYTVTFTNDDETELYVKSADYNTTLGANLPAVPDRTGYTGKWTYGGAEFTATTLITSDITVTAEYTINSYTVTFTNDDETELYVKTADYNTTLGANLPAVPDRTGYTGKWTYGGAEFTAETLVTGDITVTAEYTINSYTVTFMNGTTEVGTLNANHNTSLGLALIAVPTKTGYTGKWTYGGAEFTATTLITSDITVTVEYTINNYTVTFKDDDETELYVKSADYNTALDTNLPAVPDRTGYTGKWTYGGAEFTAETLVTGDITVTAEYTINSYTVTFMNGTTEVGTLNANHNTSLGLALIAVPTKTGYTGKWTYDGSEFTATTLITSDITVTVEYTINNYTVTFKDDDETELYVKTADYNTALDANLPAVPDRTGYTGKWTYGGAEFTAETLVTGDITVTAEYTINSYTVTFMNGTTEVGTLNANYNTSLGLALIAVPTKTGYTGKWTYDGAEFTATTLITSDITVTAEYTINSYTVTFKDDDETELYVKTADYNTALDANLPAVPDRTGYTGKWTYGGAEFTAETLVTGDITVTAEYTINSYTVTFMNGTTEVGTLNANHNTSLGLALIAVPTKTGYTGKWTYGGAEFTATTLITSDITVTAEYTINSYTVTFVNNDETSLYVITYNTSLGEDMPAVPQKTGYTVKWIYDGAEFTAETLVTGDITVTAEYTINSYTVTFKDDDESELYTKTADYNTALGANLPAVPDRTGYTVKWTYGGSEFTATMPITSDITVTAEYTINNYTVTFKDDDETELYVKTADYNTALGANLPAVPDRTGYTVQWTYDGSEFTAETLVTGDITVTAEYTIITLTVRYISSYDSSELYSVDCDYGDTIPAYTPLANITAADSEELVYMGWDTVFGDTDTVTEDMDITAKYVLRSSIAQFFAYSPASSQTDEYTNDLYIIGDTATLPEKPSSVTVPTGMSFGWFDATSGFTGTPLINGETGCGNAISSYSDSALSTSTVYAPGSTITISENKRLVGYCYTEVDYTANNSIFMSAGDTLTEKTYTTGYAILGKTLAFTQRGALPISAYYELFPAAPADVLSFVEWVFWDTSTNSAVSSTATVEAGKTYTAKASIADSRYVVTFYDRNSSAVSVQRIAAGESAVAPSVDYDYTSDDSTEYVFIRWDTAYDNIQADTEIHPVYSAKSNVYEVLLMTTSTNVLDYRLYIKGETLKLPVIEDATLPSLENGLTYGWIDTSSGFQGFKLADNPEAAVGDISAYGSRGFGYVAGDDVYVGSDLLFLAGKMFTLTVCDEYPISDQFPIDTPDEIQFFIQSASEANFDEINYTFSYENYRSFMMQSAASGDISYQKLTEIADIQASFTVTGSILMIPTASKTDTSKHMLILLRPDGTLISSIDVSDGGSPTLSAELLSNTYIDTETGNSVTLTADMTLTSDMILVCTS